MKDGVMQQCDTPLNLYHHPVNMFVAAFIGSPSMNFVDAKVVKNAEGYALDTGSFKVQAPARGADALKAYEGQTVAFGVRPPDLFGKDHLPPNLKSTEGNTIRALCEVTEPMGDRMHLYLSAGGHPLVADMDSETQVQEEKEFDLVMDLDRTHAFDKKTEQAIY
jgi:multiple sugar transport system ATP-binding protein